MGNKVIPLTPVLPLTLFIVSAAVSLKTIACICHPFPPFHGLGLTGLCQGPFPMAFWQPRQLYQDPSERINKSVRFLKSAPTLSIH